MGHLFLHNFFNIIFKYNINNSIKLKTSNSDTDINNSEEGQCSKLVKINFLVLIFGKIVNGFQPMHELNNFGNSLGSHKRAHNLRQL